MRSKCSPKRRSTRSRYLDQFRARAFLKAPRRSSHFPRPPKRLSSPSQKGFESRAVPAPAPADRFADHHFPAAADSPPSSAKAKSTQNSRGLPCVRHPPPRFAIRWQTQPSALARSKFHNLAPPPSNSHLHPSRQKSFQSKLEPQPIH